MRGADRPELWLTEQLAKLRRDDACLDVLLGLIAGPANEARQDRPAVDGKRFVALVRAHALVPCVARALHERPSRRVPEAATTALVTEWRAAAMENLRMAQCLLRVLAALEAERIEALAFKGPVLALQAFGELGARTFLDLDLLVPRADARRAAAALAAAGFAPETVLPSWASDELFATRGEMMFWHEHWQLAVDLHTALIEPGYSFALPPEEVFGQISFVDIGGRAVRTLAAEMLWVWLCFHAAKHDWNALSAAVDLAALWRRQAPDPRSVLDLAGRLGTTRMLGLGVLFAEYVGGVAPAPELRELAREQLEHPFARFAVTRAIARWRAPPPLRDRRPFDDVLLATLEQPADVARYALRLVARPTAHEWALVELPARLRKLYVPLRLLRVGARACGRLARTIAP